MATATKRRQPALGQGRTNIRFSEGLDDRGWDSFVERTLDGHYTQSTAWAKYKSTSGWTAARATVSLDDHLVAGTQLLVRPFPLLGAVGYVLNGPVSVSEVDDALSLAMDALEELCRHHRIRYLVMQPPQGTQLSDDDLARHGFRRNDRFGNPSATARVDLTPEPEAILANMRRSTRANIRRGLRRGLTAREGDEQDIPSLLELYGIAARRKGFATAATSRYEALWKTLSQAGLAKLFLVESKDEVVSAQLGLRFGDTFYSHMMAWSGQHADQKPNELLDWTAMMWAKDNACRAYDFEGMEAGTPTASAVEGHDATGGSDCYVSDYKRGFGVEVIPVPGCYDHAPNPLLRWGLHTLVPMVADRPAMKRLERRLIRVVSGRLREGTLVRDIEEHAATPRSELGDD